MEADLSLTILYVADLGKAVELFDTAFGFDKSVSVPEYVEYRVNAGACIGLMPQGNTKHFLGAQRGAKMPVDGCPRGEVYLLVNDLDAAVERLLRAGAECTSPLADRDWGDRAAYFLIPDGYVIAVAQRLA